MELWGGVECTVNRTNNLYRDQVVLTGHHDRDSDLDLFAQLGIKAIRYPVVWERTEQKSGMLSWNWSDKRLKRLRELNIRPIVGLLHHGSGPRHTDLLDDGFAEALGRYAGKVAERYPWITDWTPVNEPLTTARFSALYGHWYPHLKDERAFWRSLLNQVDGIRAAMRAIRKVIPSARLIQTDDLGRTYATPVLRYQAEHDNIRRWSGWDLLFGHVTSHHPIWQRLVDLGLSGRLQQIADDPCPPDVVGINHYLTSDRFLDHRLDRYPVHLHGSNGNLSYADTEAVRVLDPAPLGLSLALKEAWERYGKTMVVTEVHNGSTPIEQMRWAAEAWDTAAIIRTAGADVRAVTAWALVGSHGWDTLLTAPGSYEQGVFDISSGVPQRTELSDMWSALSRDASRNPQATGRGWWRRQDRLIYPASRSFS